EVGAEPIIENLDDGRELGALVLGDRGTDVDRWLEVDGLARLQGHGAVEGLLAVDVRELDLVADAERAAAGLRQHGCERTQERVALLEIGVLKWHDLREVAVELDERGHAIAKLLL